MKNETKNWTAANIPQRTEGLALITGSTEGVGYEDALTLSSAGWTVVMMGHNAQKGTESIARIRQINPRAKVIFEKIDLADLSSIKAFTSKMNKKGQAIDLLINNTAKTARNCRWL